VRKRRRNRSSGRVDFGMWWGLSRELNSGSSLRRMGERRQVEA
jgi:hypothetical protein